MRWRFRGWSSWLKTARICCGSNRAWPWVVGHLPAEGGWFAPTADMLADTAGDVADGWQEWWPAGVFALPLRRRSGVLLGWCIFLLDAPPADEVQALLDRAGKTWAYAWESLAGKPRIGWHTRWQALSLRRRRLVLAALVIFCFLPVRQTALAPAEVVAVDAMAITAALDGVVKTVRSGPARWSRRVRRFFRWMTPRYATGWRSRRNRSMWPMPNYNGDPAFI